MITLETDSQKDRQTHTHTHAHVCTNTHAYAHMCTYTLTSTSKNSNFKKPDACSLGTSGLKIRQAIPSYLLLLTVIIHAISLHLTLLF